MDDDLTTDDVFSLLTWIHARGSRAREADRKSVRTIRSRFDALRDALGMPHASTHEELLAAAIEYLETQRRRIAAEGAVAGGANARA